MKDFKDGSIGWKYIVVDAMNSITGKHSAGVKGIGRKLEKRLNSIDGALGEMHCDLLVAHISSKCVDNMQNEPHGTSTGAPKMPLTRVLETRDMHELRI